MRVQTRTGGKTSAIPPPGVDAFSIFRASGRKQIPRAVSRRKRHARSHGSGAIVAGRATVSGPVNGPFIVKPHRLLGLAPPRLPRVVARIAIGILESGDR